MNMDNLFKEEKEGGESCKGHLFSHRLNCYVGSRGEVVEKRVFTPLKRASCKGCEVCWGIMEMLADEMSEGDQMIPYPTNLNDTDDVLLVAINDGRCFEDLYDEWHLEFRKVGK